MLGMDTVLLVNKIVRELVIAVVESPVQGASRIRYFL